MEKEVFSFIATEIEDIKCFSISVDSTLDVSHTDLLIVKVFTHSHSDSVPIE